MKLNVIAALLALLLSANIAYTQPQHGFRVTFADKRGTIAFSNPLNFLSQRSLDRRTAQNITLDSTDLPVSPIYMDSVLRLTGGIKHLTSRWMNYGVILLHDSSKILTLQGQAFITNIEYIAYYSNAIHLKTGEHQNEKFKNETIGKGSQNKSTGEQSFYGASYGQTRIVNGDYLHDRSYMGQGMLIAVCDEGFQYVDTNPGFDSLMRSGRLIDRHNFISNDNNTFVTGTHGTASLSTMAGYLPGTYVGSAPLAQYAIYNTEYPGEQPIEMDNLVAAAERADSIGADVITESLGYNEFYSPLPYKMPYSQLNGHTTIVARAANMATQKGIIYVASAGNEGANPSWLYVLTPGDADSAITVGSVDLNGSPAASSSRGPNAAGRIKPDVALVGNPATIMDFDATPRPANGTSFATPQLAGWAACLLQATSKGTPNRIRNAIVQSASMYNTPTNVQLGYGIPDFGRAVELLDVKDTPATPIDFVRLHANPIVNGQIAIDLNHTKTGVAQFLVTDISGRVVLAEEHNLPVGRHNISLSSAALSSGVYFLTVVSNNRQLAMKLVKP